MTIDKDGTRLLTPAEALQIYNEANENSEKIKEEFLQIVIKAKEEYKELCILKDIHIAELKERNEELQQEIKLLQNRSCSE